MKKTILVPPDGGYGWVIVFAAALNNFFVVPLMLNTGLIFKDKFAEIGMSATEQSFIVTIHSAFGLLTGLGNAALLNRFGYRKVAVTGALLVFFGLVASSFCNSFEGYIIAYGMVASLGSGFTAAAHVVAINTYFTTKISKAIGLSMTITGLGPICIPQIIDLLFHHFDSYGVVLILAGINAHILISAVLLQPVKYHMVKKDLESEELEKIVVETEEQLNGDEAKYQIPEQNTQALLKNNRMLIDSKSNRLKRKNSSISLSYDIKTADIVGMNSILGASMYSLESFGRQRKVSTSSLLGQRARIQSWNSAQTVNLENSYDLIQEKKPEKPSEEIYHELSVVYEPDTSALKELLQRLVDMFDLTLLKDSIYVNILIGVSLVIFADANFSTLTPFILADIGLTTTDIAKFLSCLGIADIICRFLAPYISDFVKQPPRSMLLLILLGIITVRFVLILVSADSYLILVAIALGGFKGVRVIYLSLVIPMYVPLERLAAAFGMQMMVNGLCIFVGGPLLGVLRDYTGSYNMCVVIMNGFSFTTIMMWITEMIIVKIKNKKKMIEKTAFQDI